MNKAVLCRYNGNVRRWAVIWLWETVKGVSATASRFFSSPLSKCHSCCGASERSLHFTDFKGLTPPVLVSIKKVQEGGREKEQTDFSEWNAIFLGLLDSAGQLWRNLFYKNIKSHRPFSHYFLLRKWASFITLDVNSFIQKSIEPGRGRVPVSF